MSVSPAAAGRLRRRPVPDGRLGRALRWLRWPVLILWVAAIVLLHPLAGRLYQVTNDTAAANLPSSAQSTRVALIQEAARHGTARQLQSDTVAVIMVRKTGLTPGDLATVASARAAVGRLAGRSGPLGPPGRVRRSPDGQ